jgi:hypothetical protein
VPYVVLTCVPLRTRLLLQGGSHAVPYSAMSLRPLARCCNAPLLPRSSLKYGTTDGAARARFPAVPDLPLPASFKKLLVGTSTAHMSVPLRCDQPPPVID